MATLKVAPDRFVSGFLGMSQVSKPTPVKTRWLGGVGCALTFAIGTPTILLLLCLCGGLFYWWQGISHRQELAKQEQRVRDSGEPLDGAELNEWYRIPDGDDDLTSLYLAILEPFGKDDPKPDPIGVPYFDSEVEQPPLPGQPWDDMDRSEAFLANYESTFALLPEILEREGSVRYPADFRQGFSMRLPHAEALRPFAKLCCLRALVLCRQQNFTSATDSLVAALRAAETLQNEPCLVSQLVRISMHSSLDRSIASVLADEKYPIDEMQRLQAELVKMNRDSASRIGLIGERAGNAYPAMLGTFEELKKQTGSDAVRINGLTNRPLRDLRPGDCALLLQWSTDAIDACRAEYSQLWRDQKAFADKADAFLMQEKGKNPWSMNIVTALVLPPYDALFTACARGVAEHRCTIVLLAAEKYRREEGAYPGQLNQLVPRHLVALPSDPITGEPLRMRHENGRFLVYGMGNNEQDDGGDIDQIPGRQPLDTVLSIPPYSVETGDRPPQTADEESTPEGP